MRNIRVTATDEEGVVLDIVTLEVPAEVSRLHVQIVRPGRVVTSEVGEDLEIGKGQS